ncbi:MULTISPECIES: photosystem I reaction center subunit VIII [Fischerella]|nr:MULTISPECIES: photosystem I reaction center subunit VIII [Fischerella]
MTQLTGDYAASWLPWIMIPLVFYILPFPVFAILFLWIQKEASEEIKETDNNLAEIGELEVPNS